jgi:phenol 2-monooxygenase
MPVKTTKTDLLIIGAGPAGLMAATWASTYNVSARIIDNKPDRVKTGHADGLTCRTMEVLDSFGLAEKFYRDTFHDIEMCSWVCRRSVILHRKILTSFQKPNEKGCLHRSQRVVTQKQGISRFKQCTISQGRIEEAFLEFLDRDEGRVRVERNVVTVELKTQPEKFLDNNSYPISVRVRHGSTDKQNGNGNYGIVSILLINFLDNIDAEGKKRK